MIVVLKDKSIFTLKGGVQVTWDSTHGQVICHSSSSKYQPMAHFSAAEILGVFIKDEDYVHSVGAELVRNLKDEPSHEI